MRKKKAGMKMLAWVLTVVMFLTMQGISAFSETAAVKAAEREMPENPVHHCTKDDAKDNEDYTGEDDTTDWSYVYFGSYPQTEVTGSTLTAAITEASYDTNDDAWVNGIKYHRCRNMFLGELDKEYHYFKWERIKWRVLQNNGKTLFVVADNALDLKHYNEEDISITWENSTLRNWLNNDFYNRAFSSIEQGAIVEQLVVNMDNLRYGTKGGNDTRDKIYLLSGSEVLNSEYGFCEGEYSDSRNVGYSDLVGYKDVNGLCRTNEDTNEDICAWRLRSPGAYQNCTEWISGDPYYFIGGINNAGLTCAYPIPCAPALHINLSSDLWSLTDDGTCGEGGGGTDEGNDNDSLQCAKSCQVEVGNTEYVTALVYGDSYQNIKATADSIIWKSENSSIATVENTGFQLSVSPKTYQSEEGSREVWSGIGYLKITGISEGTTTITGRGTGGITAKCKVIVEGADNEIGIIGGGNGGGGSLKLGADISGNAGGGVSRFFPDTFTLKNTVFPVEISKSTDKQGNYTIKGSVGIGRSNLLDNETEWCKFKKTVEDYQKAVKRNVALTGFMEQWGVKSASFVEVSRFKKMPKLSVMGYFESKYDKNGNLISQTGKVAANAKWSGSKTWQFATPIGPVYLNLEGSGTLSGMLGPKYDYSKKELQIVDGGLKFTPAIALEGGYGIDKIATIGAQGKLSFPITLIPNIKGEVEAEAFLHVQIIFVIDYTQELASTGAKTIWDLSKNKEKGNGKNTGIHLSEGTLSAMDTSFAQYESAWCGSETQTNAIDRVGIDENEEIMLQDGILPSSLPMQAEIGGKKVMVFQAYDSARGILNSSVLKYSVYENGAWSVPQPVWDNGFCDMYADMKTVNGKLVLVWQKEKTAISGDADVNQPDVIREIARNSEICFAEFDAASNTFTNQTYVTNNQEYDMMPKICDEKDEIVVSWVRNSMADLMQESGTNAIYTSVWNGSSFETEEILVQPFGTVEDFIVYHNGTDRKALYIGQTGTEETVTAVFDENNQTADVFSGIIQSAKEGAISGMHYADGTVRFFSNGMLYNYHTEDGTIDVYTADGNAFGSTAKYCTNGRKSGYVWSTYDEKTQTSAILASMATETGFSAPVILYEKKGVIWRYISPVLDGAGNWQLLTNAMQTDNEEENHHSLIYVIQQPKQEIELAGASIDENDVVNGLTGVNYYVTNTGDTPIQNLQLDICLADGTVITKEIPVTILPGESVADTAYVDLSDVDSAQEISIRIYAKEQLDTENCTVTDMVGLSDVAVSGTVLESGNNVIVTADVSNISTMDADTTLYLYSDETQTKELCDPQTEIITANGKKQFRMTVKKRDVTYNKNNAAYLTLKAVVKDGDYNEDNNVSYAILYKQKATSSVSNPNQNYKYDYKPDKVKLKKVKSNKKGELSVKWKYVGASGYQIQYALNKTFTKGKRTKNVDLLKSNITLKKLKSKKKYFVRVRAYNKKYYLFSDGYYKVYGPWSNVKKCKIK